MSPPSKLNFITGNKNKLSEVRAIIGNVIEVESQSIDIPEIQGTSEDIAREKCRRAAEVVSPSGCLATGASELEEWQQVSVSDVRLTCSSTLGQVGGPVLTEDTALEFRAFKGLPGPYMFVSHATLLLCPTIAELF